MRDGRMEDKRNWIREVHVRRERGTVKLGHKGGRDRRKGIGGNHARKKL